MQFKIQNLRWCTYICDPEDEIGTLIGHLPGGRVHLREIVWKKGFFCRRRKKQQKPITERTECGHFDWWRKCETIGKEQKHQRKKNHGHFDWIEWIAKKLDCCFHQVQVRD